MGRRVWDFLSSVGVFARASGLLRSASRGRILAQLPFIMPNLRVNVALSTGSYNFFLQPPQDHPVQRAVDTYYEEFVAGDTAKRCALQLELSTRWPALWSQVRRKITGKLNEAKLRYDALQREVLAALADLNRSNDKLVRKRMTKQVQKLAARIARRQCLRGHPFELVFLSPPRSRQRFRLGVCRAFDGRPRWRCRYGRAFKTMVQHCISGPNRDCSAKQNRPAALFFGSPATSARQPFFPSPRHLR